MAFDDDDEPDVDLMRVRTATQKAIENYDAKTQASPLAAMALSVAESVDLDLKDRSKHSRELSRLLAELDKLGKPKEVDPVDEVAARRANRRPRAKGKNGTRVRRQPG